MNFIYLSKVYYYKDDYQDIDRIMNNLMRKWMEVEIKIIQKYKCIRIRKKKEIPYLKKKN